MTTNNDEHKINFLTTAIADAQELIRFIDTKTAIVITIIGAFLVTFFSFFPTIIEFNEYLSYWFWIWQFCFILTTIFSIIITLRIIKPTNNPIDNLQIISEHKPNLSFFIGMNKYNSWTELFINSKKSKLNCKHIDYLNSLNDSDNSVIINSLTVELEKVSFIRNIKNDRFNLLVKFVIINSLFFILSFCFITIEINNAKKIKATNENTKKATANRGFAKLGHKCYI